MRYVTHSELETEALAQSLALHMEKGDILLLYGDMGAGKTAFVRGLARGLGCESGVSSPTFTLMHRYDGGRFPLYHFDLYRLSNVEEVIQIGFEDVLFDGVAAIEWPDAALPLLPGDCARVSITEVDTDNEDIREIIVEGIKGAERFDMSGG